MGVLRLFLALSVIVLHTQSDIFGLGGVGGFYAVNIFFMISGFYMAMILTEKYRSPNPWLFYKSRLLRLFPTYLIGIVLGAVISWDALRSTFAELSWPGQFYFIFQNLFMVPQDLTNILCIRTVDGSCARAESLSANPPSWTLAVELGFYLVAPFIVRSPRRTVAYFLAGCVYLFSTNFFQFPVKETLFLAGTGTDPLPFTYNFYAASFVFFASGALAYQLSKGMARPVYWLAIVGIVLLATTPNSVVPFWHVPIFAAAIPVLFAYTKSNRWDRLIGELSFPVYVLHFPVIQILAPRYGFHLDIFGFLSLGSWVALISIAGALVVHFTIEKVVNVYRSSERFLHSGAGLSPITPDRESLVTRLLPRVALVPYFLLPVVVVSTVLVSQA